MFVVLLPLKALCITLAVFPSCISRFCLAHRSPRVTFASGNSQCCHGEGCLLPVTAGEDGEMVSFTLKKTCLRSAWTFVIYILEKKLGLPALNALKLGSAHSSAVTNLPGIPGDCFSFQVGNYQIFCLSKEKYLSDQRQWRRDSRLAEVEHHGRSKPTAGNAAGRAPSHQDFAWKLASCH